MAAPPTRALTASKMLGGTITWEDESCYTEHTIDEAEYAQTVGANFEELWNQLPDSASGDDKEEILYEEIMYTDDASYYTEETINENEHISSRDHREVSKAEEEAVTRRAKMEISISSPSHQSSKTKSRQEKKRKKSRSSPRKKKKSRKKDPNTDEKKPKRSEKNRSKKKLGKRRSKEKVKETSSSKHKKQSSKAKSKKRSSKKKPQSTQKAVIEQQSHTEGSDFKIQEIFVCIDEGVELEEAKVLEMSDVPISQATFSTSNLTVDSPVKKSRPKHAPSTLKSRLSFRQLFSTMSNPSKKNRRKAHGSQASSNHSVRCTA
ncbi:MAG: hypothetical protein SGBAC_008730 [Bacillariaceae sp.]